MTLVRLAKFAFRQRRTKPKDAVVRVLLIASVLLCGLASAATLEERMQRQEDLQAIEKLLHDYGRLLDARDFEGYGRLFAQDGEWIGGFGRLKGPAEITKVVGA